MEQKSMTALVSAFARWYHAEHNDVKLFDDSLAEKILTDDEKRQIANSMCDGIGFFNPGFHGDREDALRWIVDNQLSPTPLGRAVWAEKSLEMAVKEGATQYLIIAAGYDTFPYRQPKWAAPLQIFELDHPGMSLDKQARVKKSFDVRPSNLTYIPIELTKESLSEKLYSCAVYDRQRLTFCSLLGISYYLSKEHFSALLRSIASSVATGSLIAFDYPDECTHTNHAGKTAQRSATLAAGAGETMLAAYSHNDIARLLCDCGFRIHAHLTPDEMTEQYFNDYNTATPDHLITASDNVNYCLAERVKIPS